jgi:hypothetical protein
MTFNTPEAFDQVITPAKKATELLLLMSGDIDTFQSSCLEFSCQVSTVYLICFCGYLFITSGDVSRIDYEHLPTTSCEGMIDMIAAAAAFIATLYLVLWKMSCYVAYQKIGIGLHSEPLKYEMIFLDGYCPSFFMDV